MYGLWSDGLGVPASSLGGCGRRMRYAASGWGGVVGFVSVIRVVRSLKFGVWGLKFECGSCGLGLRAESFGFWVWSLGFGVWSLGFEGGSTLVSDFRTRVSGFGFRVLGFGVRRVPGYKDGPGSRFPHAPLRDCRRGTSSCLSNCNQKRNELAL